MLRIIENEPEYWAALQQEPQPILRLNLAIQGIEAFSHKDSLLLKKYLEAAYGLLIYDSIPNIHRFRVGMGYYTLAARENNLTLFRRFVGIFKRVLSEEKDWDSHFNYVYNVGVICNNLAAFLDIPSAYQHSIFYLMRASHALNLNPKSSPDIKKSHKLILSTIGDTYTELKEFKLAQQYLTVAQKAIEQENYADAIPLIQNKLGGLFYETQQFDKALACFDYVIDHCYFDILKGLAWEKKAWVLMEMQKWDEAQHCLEMVATYTNEFSFIVWRIRVLKSLKRLYAARHQYQLYMETDAQQQQLLSEFLPFRHELYAFWADIQTLQPADKIVLPLVEIDTFTRLQQTPSPENLFVQSLRDIISTHYHDVSFGVDYLAQCLHISTRTLFRKTQESLKESPLHFIRQARLKAAISLLEQGQTNIGVIATQVGFRSGAYFTKIFKEEYGILPSEYMSQKG